MFGVRVGHGKSCSSTDPSSSGEADTGIDELATAALSSNVILLKLQWYFRC